MNMNHYTGQTLEYKKAIAYYALFQASLIKRPFNLFHRNNLHIRTADVERNFGNKVTWEKSFSQYFRKFIREANRLVFDSGRPCKSTNSSIFDIQETDFDLVYIDPPYLNSDGTNETANYLKCYHFLEGIANYDTWQDLMDFESNNLRFKNSNSASDFKKENIYKSLDLLIEKFRNSIVVLSYKRGGIPSIEYLVKTMKRHKSRVFTRSLKYVYALNRQNGDAKKNREVLIIGT
jgi:adenine-specific DNA-methyltransferase